VSAQDTLAVIMWAAEGGKPLPDGVYMHINRTPTRANWAALDPITTRKRELPEAADG
jgi:hypothetical protein